MKIGTHDHPKMKRLGRCLAGRALAIGTLGEQQCWTKSEVSWN